MSTFTLVRTLSGLAAADETTTKLLQRWPMGEERQAEIRRQRLHKNLKRWHVLCKIVYENSDMFPSQEVVHQHLKVQAGHATAITNKHTGETWLYPDSISFSRLDEDEFQDVWQRAVKYVCTEIIPELDEQSVRDEVYRLVGASTWQTT